MSLMYSENIVADPAVTIGVDVDALPATTADADFPSYSELGGPEDGHGERSCGESCLQYEATL